MKYPVEVTEISQRIVEVEADSRAEAEERAEELWNKEEIVLDSGDFIKASFRAGNSIKVQKAKPPKEMER